MRGFRVSGVKKQGDLYSKVSVMSEDIQVCGVLVSMCHGNIGIGLWSHGGIEL